MAFEDDLIDIDPAAVDSLGQAPGPFSPGNYADAFAPGRAPAELLNSGIDPADIDLLGGAATPDDLLNSRRAVDSLPYASKTKNGNYRLNRLPDPDELTPEIKDLHGDDTYGALLAMLQGPEATQADRERVILGNMRSAAQFVPPPMPGITENIETLAARAGMSMAEAEHWQKKDKQYLDEQIALREALRLSGPDGYFTGQLQTERGARGLRWDKSILAGIEADKLASDDSLLGGLRRLGYDFRAGFGQVGVFAAKVLAAGAQAMLDLRDSSDPLYDGLIPENSIIGKAFADVRAWTRNELEWQRDEWLDIVDDSEASWTKPEIDTGYRFWDWLRGSIGRTGPFMGGTLVLAAIPGVGAGGAAAIVAYGMGGNTYYDLRQDNVSPGLALAAGAFTSIVSYFSTKAWLAVLRLPALTDQ